MSGIKRDVYDVCPVCWSVRIKHRVFKSPRYKCEKCGSEFPNKKRISHDDRILFNDVMRIARNDLEQLCDVVDDVRLRKSTVMSIKRFVSCVK